MTTNLVRLLAFFGCLAALSARAGAEESNFWPVHVAQQDEQGRVVSWESVGPLFFEKPAPDGGTTSGFRPLFLRTEDAQGLTIESAVLYPLFVYRADRESYRWSIFELINGTGPQPGMESPANRTKGFDFWIFWFSRDTGSPDTSYHAFFPIAGTIKERFGYDELSWVLWPLYFERQKQGAITISTPWPFLQATHGTEQGFAFWPLFGWRDRPGRFHRSYFLWPLGWDNTIQPPEEAPAGTPVTRQVGFIPFYTRETRDRYINEDYLWPFFGYTDTAVPKRYHETRYLWPFLVQGRGEDRMVNRWGPFYTHSIIKGYDKTWVLWPLVRQATWTESGVVQTKTQILYVLYWSLEQKSLANPRAAPAERAHFWPLFSTWDNGAGRRQFQLFSPFDVFFPDNHLVRETWTPLFALFRLDQRAPDDKRWSLLWHAVTWSEQRDRHEFHLGPLLSVRSDATSRRVALGNGLLGWQRDATGGWHVFWFDFPRKVTQPAPVSTR